MDIDVPDDGTDYDYSWKDYGSVSNYSTLRTATREEYDYATLDRSPVPVSEEELEIHDEDYNIFDNERTDDSPARWSKLSR